MHFQSLVSVSVIQGCMLPSCICITKLLQQLMSHFFDLIDIVQEVLQAPSRNGIFVHVALLNESCMYMHNALYTYLYQ